MSNDLVASGAAALNFLAGFDDYMEEKEPGYKARCAAKRAEKETARIARTKVLLERYGSTEAGLAPCEKEKLLHKALKPWIKYSKRPHQRWTYSVNGSGSYWLFDFKDAPHIRDAVANAYPLPTTFQEALAEHDYWQKRRVEMEDLLNDQYGDEALDRPASLRADLVRDLLNHEIHITNFDDLLTRFQMHIDGEIDGKSLEALYRDLKTLVFASKRGAV